MVLYSFTKIAALDRLEQEIRASIIKTSLNHLSLLGSDLSVYFNDTLDTVDETLLNILVTNHTATPLPNPNPTVEISKQPEPLPFAQPVYRTKRMKTGNIATCVPGGNIEILFQLTGEFYTHGGAMVVENAQIGDYIYAEVEDIDGVIPAPYRNIIAEAWPVVATYIVGEWVEVQGQYSIHKIDTKPLVAKLTAGLYLSFHYVATNVGTDRKIGINYYMNKKL